MFHSAQQPQQQQQQQLVDSYGVPLHQQPQLQQHYHQQSAHLPQSNFIHPGGQDDLKIQGDFNPDFQSFNYEEQYRGSSGGQAVEYQEQEGSENVPAVTVVRKSPTTYEGQSYDQKSNTLAEDTSYFENSAASAIPENTSEDYEESNVDDSISESKAPTSYFSQIDNGNGEVSSSFYTTLPNREAAETLATLAAAGNINSHLANHLRNEEQGGRAPLTENVQPEEEVVEEEEYEDEEEQEQPEVTPAPPTTQPPQISKPINFQRQKESDIRGPTRYPNSGVRQQYHRRPTSPVREEDLEDPDGVDYEAEQDSQGTRQTDTDGVKSQSKPSNVQFGARIRPKRNK